MQHAKKILKTLRKLTSEGNANLYERIGLAAQLLDDAEWIAELHGGDYFAAHDSVEHEFFASQGQCVRLAKMIKIHAAIARERWEELRFNLVVLETEYDESNKPIDKSPATRQSVSWKAKAAELQEAVDDIAFRENRATKELETARRDITDKDELIAALRARVRELEQRVKELESAQELQAA